MLLSNSRSLAMLPTLWSQVWTIGPHNLLQRKVTLFHPKPVYKNNPQWSRSGSTPFLNFLTLGIQRDVHSSTEILIGSMSYMQGSGFHFVLYCEPRRTWEIEVEPLQRQEIGDMWGKHLCISQLLLSFIRYLTFVLGGHIKKNKTRNQQNKT